MATSVQVPTFFTSCDVSTAKARAAGDISTAFDSVWDKNNKLDDSYIEIKKKLVKDPSALKESWVRLKKALAEGIEEIKRKGNAVIPQIDFKNLETLSETQRNEIMKRGCVVIRDTVPRQDAEALKQEVIEYIERNPNTKGFPKDKKVVYELYWSKAQVKARCNANVRRTQLFMNQLWHADKDARISLNQNVMYADRMRIRQPGDKLFSLGPHADSGSLERWDDLEYSKCYEQIFNGNWEEFDAYDATHRLNVDMTKYDSSGTSNVFRSFQGWLALSDIAPKEGTILFAPLIKEVTAYWILRPFFDLEDNLKFDSEFPGSYPGTSQEFTNELHPDLELDYLMVPIPKVQPGDMVYWHCDTIHAVDSEHQGQWDSSVFYIPALPLCDINMKYAWIQRESFLKGLVPPDFPGFPHVEAETKHIGRAGPEDVEKEGGIEALQQFGLCPFVAQTNTPGEVQIVDDANKLLFV